MSPEEFIQNVLNGQKHFKDLVFIDVKEIFTLKDYSDIIFEHCAFKGCDFSNSFFKNANLEKCFLSYSIFDDVDFRDANLNYTVMYRASLNRANMFNATLKGSIVSTRYYGKPYSINLRRIASDLTIIPGHILRKPYSFISDDNAADATDAIDDSE